MTGFFLSLAIFFFRSSPNYWNRPFCSKILIKPAEKVKMTNCESCCYLTLSNANEEHVIQKHFLFEDWDNIDLRQSFFFANRIVPQDLVRVVRSIPRFQLDQIGWNYGRFIYTIAFDHDVGVYPLQYCTTNRVMIVCNCVECLGCGIHVPTEIVTMYPWDIICAQYGR